MLNLSPQTHFKASHIKEQQEQKPLRSDLQVVQASPTNRWVGLTEPPTFRRDWQRAAWLRITSIWALASRTGFIRSGYFHFSCLVSSFCSLCEVLITRAAFTEQLVLTCLSSIMSTRQRKLWGKDFSVFLKSKIGHIAYRIFFFFF